jgi:DNA-binding IclR family transcriptional regulator
MTNQCETCGQELPKLDRVLESIRKLQAGGQTATGAAVAEHSGLPKHRVYYWLEQLEERGKIRLARDTNSGRLIPGGITVL